MEYGLIGNPLKHSFSSILHPKFFDYKYELKELNKEDLAVFLRQKDFKGINVTIPYKEAVLRYLYFLDPKAREIGAVNTIVNKDGVLYGYNTDFLGLKALIEKNNIEIKGKKVLILGSGGTSKTALAVASELGALGIIRVSRTAKDEFISYAQAESEYSDAEIIINATPCGMYPNIDEMPIDISRFENLEAVCDVIYNPLRSKLVIEAQKKGIKAVGGLYMLVYQAAAAGEKFTDTAVPQEKIDAVYKELLKQKENIVLIGMPSSGKTTVGKALASATGKSFVDTDELILEKIGMPIAEYFKLHSEESFRKIESEVVASVSTLNSVIISTGGGVILNQENIDNLRKNGRIYFLDRPLDMLLTTSDRPLSSNKQDLEKRYNERYGLYKLSADVGIDGSKSIDEVSTEILEEFFK